MEADFRKGDIEWVVELCVLEAGATRLEFHPDVQSILDKYSTIFWGYTTRIDTRLGV